MKPLVTAGSNYQFESNNIQITQRKVTHIDVILS
jgi:hypothetical protein